MDPVDEYAELKAQIRRLQDRADVLRDGFLRPAARLRSNQYEVVVKRQRRRLFQKDRLPPRDFERPPLLGGKPVRGRDAPQPGRGAASHASKPRCCR
jgi:hypothetical protein